MSNPSPNNEPLSDWLEVVRAQVAALRFGAVHITVHDSKVIQIETTEKVRLDKTQPKSQKP
jgi:hypothetical protein